MFTYAFAKSAAIVIGCVGTCFGVAWNFWKTEREANRLHKLDMLEYERIQREREQERR